MGKWYVTDENRRRVLAALWRKPNCLTLRIGGYSKPATGKGVKARVIPSGKDGHVVVVIEAIDPEKYACD